MTARTQWLLLGSLYLSQGLPFGFFTQALPVLLREEGVSLSKIGLSGLLFLPWALKWLWAPWVDASASRRAWIIPLQLGSIAVALGLALVDDSSPNKLFWLQVGIVLTAFFAATQDVPTDGLAVNLLAERERGLGNAVQVGAYRLGMVLGGGALLVVLDRLGWAQAFLAMAAFLALALLPLLGYRETPAARGTARPPLRNPFTGVWARLRRPGMAALLLWLVAYKFGDSMASSLIKPYLVDAGWSKSAIGFWAGALGSAGGLLGAVLGGWAADALGRRRALLLCGLAQTAAVALYALVAFGGGGDTLLKAAIGLEHLLGGMATVALFTLMMDACDPAHASTDYSLQASTIVFATGIAGAVGGVLGDALGYGPTFALATLLSAAGCLLLLAMLAAGRAPAPLRAAWAGSPAFSHSRGSA